MNGFKVFVQNHQRRAGFIAESFISTKSEIKNEQKFKKTSF
jgi:hypothetical protein